jgi:imidazolonepropionase-like amidohydrolase
MNPARVFVAIILPALTAAQPPAQRPLAFTHVTVIDCTGGRARSDQCVVIAGDRIAGIGRTGRVRLPADAQVIDAAGRFLIPGLWDMHVHVGSDSRYYLPLFIANGVTGIRIMAGLPAHLQWRREVEVGATAGPRMVIASAILDGPKSFFTDHVVVANGDEARAAVRKARQGGADFIKVHDLVPRDAYFAIIDEARKQGLPVEGHVPLSVTPEEASDAGQISIEHLTQLDGISLSNTGSKQASQLFARFRRNHTWQCPTLVMTRSYVRLEDPLITDDARLQYVRSDVKASWKKMSDGGAGCEAAHL